MIRRWTSVNFINSDFCFFYKYSKPMYFINLKKSVRYKKLIFAYTKRRRKKVSIRKRRTNWLLYNQIFTNWSKDYRDKKAAFRFQYYQSSASLHIKVFDAMLSRKPILNELEDYELTHYTITKLPPKLFKRFYYINKTEISSIFKFNKKLFKNATIFLNSPDFVFKQSLVPLFYNYNDVDSPLFLNENIPDLTFDEISIDFSLNYIIEIYKLTIILLYFRLNNLKS